jgi:hypothetical protein
MTREQGVVDPGCLFVPAINKGLRDFLWALIFCSFLD